ncbi:translation initiation factor eIF 4e-like domain-containing protein [Pterulicium gracile]|uniref:Translation initiation factor eIF 4e-like domain-containing protein n=1 Tax=Pterulicium gracile TaxID=1884261 RepID=A0A5C3QEJ5_9AGAR|nr:translation initiation factor eIF 4e-like domain-containing protein [Pterula gracilis]
MSKPSKPRGPSLNQLAAKYSSSDASTMPPASSGTTTSSSRPRLPVSVLRTGSTTSLVTNASSAADSMAVQAPSTRSVSPNGTSGAKTPTTPSSELPVSTTPGGGPGVPMTGVSSGGDRLTSEGLDRLVEQEGVMDKNALVAASSSPPNPAPPQKKVGYKNIPSLDAIAQRLAETRQQLSVDGTSRPPEAELIEDPKTPGVHMKAPEHPLQYTWTIYHDTKSKFPPPTPHDSHIPSTPATPAAAAPTDPPTNPEIPVTTEREYEAGLTVIGEFSTVESFCRYFNWLKPPSTLARNSNYHLFKSGIKPMWEDPANADGGKWVLTMRSGANPGLLDRCWNWLAMALVGEELEEGVDEVCGAVVSLRGKVDRIQVWTRGKDDVERLNRMGKKLVKLLDVGEGDGIGLEFQYNTDDRPLPNKFLSIQAVPQSSYRSSFVPGSSPTTPGGGSTPQGVGRGGAGGRTLSSSDFGSFGTGAGIGGGSAWRGKGARGGAQ